ncbi:MAG TPA: gamma-glutamyltransferase family protein [Burkholderiales bacterium]|nr:gamma-glutamyltransferase family protein [Burkholderiales bacterium]
MLNPARGTRGMAVAPHALASQSALACLREGGNAVEAMIAAAATIAVVYPHMNSIGGDSFWLVHVPGREPQGIDACGAAARAASIGWYAERGITGSIPFRGGIAANTVAGTISGWALAHEISRELGGKLPLTRLLADAIHYGTTGIPVTRSQHVNTATKRKELEPQPGFADAFLPGGDVPAIGARFFQPKLATTLEQLARAGLGDFYRGELARSIAADLAAAGSPVTLADLEAHAAQRRTPLVLEHSVGRVFNMPPPTQGAISLAILGQLDRLGIARLDPVGADFVHLAVEATKRAFREIRDRHITDPAYMKVEAQSLLAPAKLDSLAGGIARDRAAPWGQGEPPSDTIWMGVIDGDGRAVSFIQSVYHEFGAGIVLNASGICWQNRGCSFSLGEGALNSLRPGRKPFHTLNPALALAKDGRTMVYGNMGGDGQPQTQSAVFSRTLVQGLSPQAAIEAPRWLLGRTWGQTSDTLKLESRFAPAVVDDLRRRGHDVELVGAYDEIVGHAGCVIRHPDGSFEGGADPRSDGSVAAY